jgi:hypothetical protein
VGGGWLYRRQFNGVDAELSKQVLQYEHRSRRSGAAVALCNGGMIACSWISDKRSAILRKLSLAITLLVVLCVTRRDSR